MRYIKVVFVIFISSIVTTTAYSRNFFYQQDTVIQNSDSLDEEPDCNDNFFKTCEPVPAKTILVLKNQKLVSLKKFFSNYSGADTMLGIQPLQGLKDLDNDGKKELVLYDYTGGAHCCDEFYVFKNIGPNKYQYVAKTFAGDVCVTEKNELIYSFYQQYGYFFTCFACAYQDTSDTGPKPVAMIILRYNKGKLNVVPGDRELKNTITDNLEKLKEQPYQKLQDEADQDDGLRKEFALNLAVYYYSFGKNLVQTKTLFDKYYRFPDAKKVWNEFVNMLKGIRMDSDF